MPRSLIVALVLLSCVVFALPDDILDNSESARQHMQQLLIGLAIYENEHGEGSVTDPAQLFPDYVSDPLSFWHPGDTDPAPTTIDNSVPNAPNSARISFDFACLSPDQAPCDRVVIQDNTADNNGGLFVNMITADGVIETDPPMATPTPTTVMFAQAHLRRLGVQMMVYTNDNMERFPDDPIRLWEGGFVESPRSFWNPGDSDPLPTDITNSVLDEPNSAQVSFEYLAAGLSWDDMTPKTRMMRDISSSNNGGHGINVLWGDLSVSFVPIGSMGDSNGDCHVDLADWASMHACLTGPASCILDDACRIFDWNSDSRIDLRDVARFTEEFTGPNEPLHSRACALARASAQAD